MRPFFETRHDELQSRLQNWLRQTLWQRHDDADLDQTAKKLIALLAAEGFLALGLPAAYGGGRFVLNGRKRFIFNAGVADFYIVFASTARRKKPKGSVH